MLSGHRNKGNQVNWIKNNSIKISKSETEFLKRLIKLPLLRGNFRYVSAINLNKFVFCFLDMLTARDKEENNYTSLQAIASSRGKDRLE